MLAAVRDRGPVTARHLDAEFSGPRTKEHWGWNWSDARQVLDYLFLVGDVAIAGRTSQFEVLYDVPERVLPARSSRRRRRPPAEAGRELVRRAARSHGVGTAGCLADYYRMRTIPGRTGMPNAQEAIRDLVDAGELEEVRIEGWKRPAYLHRDAPAAARGPAPAPCSARSTRWCGSGPAPSRSSTSTTGSRSTSLLRSAVHGYYVLPFLLGDRSSAGSTSRRTGRRPAARARRRTPRTARRPRRPPSSRPSCGGWPAGWAPDIIVGPRGDLAGPLGAELT